MLVMHLPARILFPSRSRIFHEKFELAGVILKTLPLQTNAFQPFKQESVNLTICEN